MEAKELRIGNLVYYKLKEIVVTTIGEYGIQSKSDETVINAKFSTPDLKPIQLTEEWLGRFGFEKDRHGFTLTDKMSLSISVTKEFGFLPCWNDLLLGSRYDLLYVHQLQNLYFALTGQELKLNDK